MSIRSINPANGELLKEYPAAPIPELIGLIEKADHAQQSWRHSSFSQRAECLTRLAELLRSGLDHHAEVITREMGKPISEAQAEVEKCAIVCEYYAEHAEVFLREERVKTEHASARYLYQPLGVIFLVMPWNFPFWQIFRAAVPALAAGNGVICKPASNVPDCGLTVEALFQQAGFPMGLFRCVLTDPQTAAVAIVDDRVRAVSLTGSTAAGKTIAAQAGTQLKKSVLELGGNDPYLVLADADLDHAAQALAAGRLRNCGQSCISVKRVIVAAEVAEDFELRLAAAMQVFTPGDPMSPDTNLGPLARADLREEVEGQVQRSIAAGARRVLGGKRPEHEGFYYEPTLLAETKPGLPCFDEEVFGPSLSLATAQNDAEAIALANASIHGLGAGIFTRDPERAERIADDLHTGQIFINSIVRSDPRLPFGGVKQSGYGREMSVFGIREFTNVQTRVHV